MIATVRRMILVVAIAAAAIAVAPAAASGATLIVDENGDDCPTAHYTTIQAAINAASDGDTIRVCQGTYVEQLLVGSKELTIAGDGQSAVTIQAPSTLTSGPCNWNGANYPVICVVESAVNDPASLTISDLTIDGDVKGAGHDRFFGIFFSDASGVVDSTTITDVRDFPLTNSVSGIAVGAVNGDGSARSVEVTNSTLVRFMAAGTDLNGSGLATSVTGNTIEGLGPASQLAQQGIQIGNNTWAGAPGELGASGTIADNTITGIETTNFINGCAHGAYLFMAPVGSITDNTLTDAQCAIEVDVTGLANPPSPVTVSGNTITRPDIGIHLLNNPGTLSGNRITGDTDTDQGVIVDLDNSVGYEYTATATGNAIKGVPGEAIMLQDPGANPPAAPSLNASFNDVAGNGYGARTFANANGVLTLTNNWFGCNEGPNQPGCSATDNSGFGPLNNGPFLVLGLTASPATILTGQSSALTADLTHNSDGASVGPGFPDGIPIAFGTDLGSVVTPASTASGQAASTFTSPTAGTADVTAALDSQVAHQLVTVNLSPLPPPSPPQPPPGPPGSVGGGGTGSQPSGSQTTKKNCKKIKSKKKRKKCKRHQS